jgi:hypothetical protein
MIDSIDVVDQDLDLRTTRIVGLIVLKFSSHE